MILLAGLAFAATARTQDVTHALPPDISPRPAVEIGLRTWISTGHSSLSAAGAMGTPPVLSTLHWSRLDNTVIELFAAGVWRDCWIVNVDFGIGTNGGGGLCDRDFNNDQSLASHTFHPVRNDQLFYVNLDFGYRFIAWEFGARSARFTLDGLIGYQHWQERYLANDGVDLFPGGRVFPPGRTGENRFAWDSMRIGASARVEYTNWSLDGQIYAIPFTSFEDIDIHYRRTDVLHDPSFIDRANGGGGVTGELTLRCRLWRGVQVEAGYRWWSLTSGAGYTITRMPGGDFVTPFNQAHTFRHGLTLGLLYQF